MFDEMMPTQEQIDKMMTYINSFTRLNTRENMIDRHSPDEIKNICYKTVMDFNTIKPVSNIGFDKISSNMATYSLFLSLFAKNLIWQLIADWTYHGNEVTIDDLTEIDRLDRYRELYADLDKEINDKAKSIKATSGLVPVGGRLRAKVGFISMSGSRTSSSTSSTGATIFQRFLNG